MKKQKKSDTEKKGASAGKAGQEEAQRKKDEGAPPEKPEVGQAPQPAADADAGVNAQAEAEPGETAPARQAQLEDRLLRLQADFDNFRKRMLREKEELYRRANEDIMLELLPVLDHLELAFSAAGTDSEEHPVIQGFSLVAEQLRAVLRKFGLNPIEAQGAFDPNVHEAVQHLPSAEVPENEIIAQLRAGYMLGSRLLRAAQVVVSSGPPEEAPRDPADEADEQPPVEG